MCVIPPNSQLRCGLASCLHFTGRCASHREIEAPVTKPEWQRQEENPGRLAPSLQSLPQQWSTPKCTWVTAEVCLAGLQGSISNIGVSFTKEGQEGPTGGSGMKGF